MQHLVEYCQLKGLLGFTLRLAILLGFFALLRISNLAPLSATSFNPIRDSTRQDLTFEPPGLQYRQRWAKNRQTTKDPQEAPKIPLPYLPNDPLDPVQAWIDLQCLTTAAGPNEPLLLIPSLTGKNYVLDQHTLREELRQAFKACNIDPAQYSSHSLRRGGASHLHQHGTPVHAIKRQGLWKSDAVNHYINDITLHTSPAIDAFKLSITKDSLTQQAEDSRAGPERRAHKYKRKHKAPQKYKKGPNSKNKGKYRPPGER